jgi:hypothetical protein
MLMGRDDVPEMRPPSGLLFIPQVIYEPGELRWNDIDRESIVRLLRTVVPITITFVHDGKIINVIATEKCKTSLKPIE